MKQTQTIPQTFIGVGYVSDRAGLPLEAVRIPVPHPAADEVLIRVAASSLNPLEYKLAELNFTGRTPPSLLASTFPASSSPRAMACAARVSVGRHGGPERQRRLERDWGERRRRRLRRGRFVASSRAMA